MLAPPILISLLIAGQDFRAEGPHAANHVLHAVINEGIAVEGGTIRLPAPRIRDGQSAGAQRAELARVAGSERGIGEFLRDSVSAPIVLKLRDESTPGHQVRAGDLWFAVHADFDAIDPKDFGLASKDPRPVEAGNMRFASRLVAPEDLKDRGIEPPAEEGFPRDWYVHLTGRLLDRIQVEETQHAAATRSAASWVVASRTDRRFDAGTADPNRWWPIVRRGAREEPGPSHPYPGGASYASISRVAGAPGVLVAEVHFAFAEPRPWFDGAPILRSKIGVIAQDRVRQLRRELARRKKARPEPKQPGR